MIDTDFRETSNNTDNKETESSQAKPPFSERHRQFDRVRIAETKDCGLGVFTLVPVKKRRAIGRVYGKLMPQGYRSEYCVEFGEGALEPAEPYRYLNHSCSPNCEFIEWQISEEGAANNVIELWVHALRNIQVGEELTIDYGWDWNSAIPCHCGSVNCRGWICKKEDLEKCKHFHQSLSDSIIQ